MHLAQGGGEGGAKISDSLKICRQQQGRDKVYDDRKTPAFISFCLWYPCQYLCHVCYIKSIRGAGQDR